jgi:raffinose/stachyose/melibiose transport system substrate-binding protein
MTGRRRASVALLTAGVVTALAVGAATSGGSALAGGTTSKAFPTGPVHLTMWWWGEQEAAGAKKWLADTIALYHKKHPNVTIQTVLQTTNGLVPAFKAAAAAKKGPDLQYFWGGIWSLEDAWAGSTKPVSDYIPASELKHYLNTAEDTYNGKIWTAGWYVQPSFPVLYRRDVLAKAGGHSPAHVVATPRGVRHVECEGHHAARRRDQRRVVRRLALLDHRRPGRQFGG